MALTTLYIGNATKATLHRFEDTADPWAGATDPRAAGDGSIMRLAPVALWTTRSGERDGRLGGTGETRSPGAESLRGYRC